jgi:hypothetical protein
VRTNNQYNEDTAAVGPTLCPEEAGGWTSKPIPGRIKEFFVLKRLKT